MSVSIAYKDLQDRWRNGSAFASRAKGYPFKSGVVQNLIIQPMILTWEFIFAALPGEAAGDVLVYTNWI